MLRPGARANPTLCVLLVLCAQTSAQTGFARAETVRVRAVEPDLRLRLDGGRRVRLQGVDAPSAHQADERARLRSHLRALLVGTAGLRWQEQAPGLGILSLPGAGRSLNLQLLGAGRAVLRLYGDQPVGVGEMVAAVQRAARARRGWFGRCARPRLSALPFLNGAVCGLYHQVASADYHAQLDALKSAGFRHVSLLFSVFVDRVDSSTIRRDLPRTCPDARLRETIAYARKQGMSVMLLPIVLIRKPGEDDWRGVLRPKDEARFWREYEAMLRHYLDLAAESGVDLFCVGSELGSLEHRKQRWLRLIQTARGRFPGFLTYSANWDHAHVPGFGQALDLMGITGYFTLTQSKQPSDAQLAASWDKISQQLRSLSLQHGKKLVITELGYASQDGCNIHPWNYMLDRDNIDLGEQASCFRAFRRFAPKMEFLGGAYFYDVYDKGGPEDWSYSPRGKPAWAEWQKWARYRPAEKR